MGGGVATFFRNLGIVAGHDRDGRSESGPKPRPQDIGPTAYESGLKTSPIDRRLNLVNGSPLSIIARSKLDTLPGSMQTEEQCGKLVSEPKV